jgi:hypothetical protein
LYTSELTWRELSSYVAGLSPQAATRTALNDGVPEPTGEQILLADVFDAVAINDWHFSAANTAENKPTPKKPAPYPRWWLKQRQDKNTPQRLAKLAAARQRRQERQKAITDGRIA